MQSPHSTSYSRRKTRVVWVGQIAVGGHYPVRVQSMTTSDTKDTQAVVAEIEALVARGCEIVRVTVPTQADCDNLPSIRAEMKRRGLKVPLVADIHFTPSIALQVVDHVEKVRINPGNFVDKKLFKTQEYTDGEYASELARIREKFEPLVLKCRERGVAMRIGTNHGSLSDRIMNRYGDTPLGMVESALEFLRICRDHDYHDIVLSMKASNVQVMIAAYRLLARRLDELGWDYPFHLGVTEAGEGEDGRVKSAIGIGALLEDGIGDTIRVSLTEDSIHEIPVAYQLVKKYNASAIDAFQGGAAFEIPSIPAKPEAWEYRRRSTLNFNVREMAHGHLNPVRVWAGGGDRKGYAQKPVALDCPIEGAELPLSEWVEEGSLPTAVRLRGAERLKDLKPWPAKVVMEISKAEETKAWEAYLGRNPDQVWEWLLTPARLGEIDSLAQACLGVCARYDMEKVFFSVLHPETLAAYRQLARSLRQSPHAYPLHLRIDSPLGGEAGLIQAAVQAGALLMEGLGDSLQLDYDATLEEKVRLSYNILQGCRLRITKTEYISCPSCGRTLFDLQATTDRIRRQTGHLKGVKIAVMGCIVNGPGEMADADFGYVGTGVKKVSLYVGKECVQRNLPEEAAVGALISLIKNHNRWVEPPLNS